VLHVCTSVESLAGKNNEGKYLYSALAIMASPTSTSRTTLDAKTLKNLGTRFAVFR
jgi:hypothetical protein